MTEQQSITHDLAQSCRGLWVKVVHNAIEDDIREQNKSGLGADNMARWLNSSNGREVLQLAGLVPCDRTIQTIIDRVQSGVTMTPKGRRLASRREA